MPPKRRGKGKGGGTSQEGSVSGTQAQSSQPPAAQQPSGASASVQHESSGAPQGGGRGRGRGRGQGQGSHGPGGHHPGEGGGGARGPPGSQPRGPSPQGYQPRGPPPQGYQPQGPPPQGYQPRGPPPQGYQPRGPPPQGYQPRGPPPQGSQPQGPPPQGYQPRGPSPQSSQPMGPPPQTSQPQGPQQGPVKLEPTSTQSGATVSSSQGGPQQPSSALEKPFQGLSLTPAKSFYKVPTRDMCNKAEKVGRPIPIEVNHLLVTIKDVQSSIYHYDVEIDPDKPKRLMRPAVEAMRVKHFAKNHPGFDGKKNLYSRGRLPIPNGVISDQVFVADDERTDAEPKGYTVTIKEVRVLSLKELFNYQIGGASTNPPQDAIQAIDIVLRSASARNFVQVGRSFYAQSEGMSDLGHGLEMWLGFFQSFIMGQRPYLNIDVAHKGFPKDWALLDILNDMDPRAPPFEPSRYQLANFEKFIKGLKIEYMIPNIPSSKRVFKVNGLTRPAAQERFKMEDGTELTIQDYFRVHRNYKVKFSSLPCVHVGPPNKQIRVPLELCRILPGQPTVKKMDENQTASMVKLAATNTAIRKQKIRDAMRKAKINESPEVREFGLSVANEFTSITARVLPPPKLMYDRREVTPAKGIWRGEAFQRPSQCDKWVIVNAGTRVRQDCIQNLSKMMVSEANRLHMQIGPHSEYINIDQNMNTLQRNLNSTFQRLKEQNVRFAIVIISDRNQTYSPVKQVAEIQVGILTQCIKDFTVERKLSPPTVHNILLKVNSKLNGVNHTISDNTVPRTFQAGTDVLVVGADVTHPSPDSRDIPSVAAVTASYDLKGFQYNMRIRLQPPRMEIIMDLKNIIHEQLRTYFERTKHKPKHIIFYRDGVSEGQFQQVLDSELHAILEACKMCSPNYRPKVTFLVVQKRHHTRFFPMNPKDSDDRNGNVPAGTIVDTEITHPTEVDFYLVSHASIQGVARPTKYHVLWDDARMSENDIHCLTYNLCHLFTRCDRAVSYPAPTYYAHLAAARGRVYLEGKDINLSDLSKASKVIENCVQMANPMFFV